MFNFILWVSLVPIFDGSLIEAVRTYVTSHKLDYIAQV